MSYWSEMHLLEAGGNAEELLQKVARITTWSRQCRFVWRGHADESWTLHSGLFERIQARSGTPPDEATLRADETSLIDRARRRELGGAIDTPELQRLAVLQHYGTATRLIDVTTDPMIALWFACEDEERTDKKGILFAINVADAVHLDWTESRSVADVIDALGTDQLAVFWPGALDARIQVQRGAFVFGRVPDNARVRAATSVPISIPDWTVDQRRAVFRDRGPGRRSVPTILALRIPQHTKRRLLSILSRSYGYTVESIYPDIDGFSRANGRRSRAP